MKTEELRNIILKNYKEELSKWIIIAKIQSVRNCYYVCNDDKINFIKDYILAKNKISNFNKINDLEIRYNMLDRKITYTNTCRFTFRSKNFNLKYNIKIDL